MGVQQNIYQKWILATWYVAGVCIVSLLYMYILSVRGVDWREEHFYLAFSIPVLLVVAITLPVLYYYGKKYARTIQELLQGEHWARWTYQQDEWEKFSRSEWSRAKKKAFWLFVGVPIGFSLYAKLFRDWNNEELVGAAPIMLGVGAFAAFIQIMAGYSTHRQRQKSVGEVYIAPKGVYFDGRYHTWDMVGTKLRKVEVREGDPPVLEFSVATVKRSASEEIRVPIPRGRESEAAQLIQQFNLNE